MIVVAAADAPSKIQMELRFSIEEFQYYFVPISNCCETEFRLKDDSREDVTCGCGDIEYYFVPRNQPRWYISPKHGEDQKFARWMSYWTGFPQEELEVDIKW